jgi:D-lactate dehydrogenase
MTNVGPGLLGALRGTVGRRNVLTRRSSTRPFRRGYRSGAGDADVVVRPGSLVELWRVAQLLVEADVSIIMQAANTGLTGGSTPDGSGYPGGVAIVSTTRIRGVHLLDGGRQVVCLAGTTLFDLERALKPVGREPHSVIGSSCIGASVIGGICNNSGGALVQRGPAYTEFALFGRVTAVGSLELVNHLGIRLGGKPENMLRRLEEEEFDAADVDWPEDGQASDSGYAAHVRDVDAATPARFNADPRRLFEASGSAGRLILFAVRLDTFAAEERKTTFYIGTNNPADLTAIRRAFLTSAQPLPIAAEYLHRTAFDTAAVYGKDMFLAVQYLGTHRLPRLFAAKARADALASAFGFRRGLPDRVLHRLAGLLPGHLPERMYRFRDWFEHHLVLAVAGDGAEARSLLEDLFPAASGHWFECSATEATKAFLHRFVVAGAAVRYRDIHSESVEDIIALDVALPRNERMWIDELEPEVERALSRKLYYGHFFCHVFHQDYVVARGKDVATIERRMLDRLHRRGAECPAEHNVGHHYRARPQLAAFYRSNDPRNQLNPGIGRTTKHRDWAADEGDKG